MLLRLLDPCVTSRKMMTFSDKTACNNGVVRCLSESGNSRFHYSRHSFLFIHFEFCKEISFLAAFKTRLVCAVN